MKLSWLCECCKENSIYTTQFQTYQKLNHTTKITELWNGQSLSFADLPTLFHVILS